MAGHNKEHCHAMLFLATHSEVVVHSGTAIVQQGSGHSDVIKMYVLGSGVQLHCTLNASVVEEIHLEVLDHLTINIANSTCTESMVVWRMCGVLFREVGRGLYVRSEGCEV